MLTFETLSWNGDLEGHCDLLEQTLLPEREERLAVHTVEDMVDAIRRLAVRGAPAIGIAGAYGLVLALRGHVGDDQDDPEDIVGRVREAAAVLARARPTAVNLFWGLDRVVARAEREHASGASARAIAEAVLEEARAIHAEDSAQCLRMGELGAELLGDDTTVLTHCNAGALATGGIGTALAPLYVAAEGGRTVRVFADETRPLLQGARLTAWELQRAGIDVTLLVDGAMPGAFASGKIDAVFVGSDRIARNGDVCNKVGTYGVAVLARRHGVPFYVVAPLSTFDPKAESGADIPIEERAAGEVAAFGAAPTAPEGVSVWNPAFDVTPAELVTAIVTEVGVIRCPTRERVEAALRAGGRL